MIASFAQRLRTLRKAKDLYQKELAEKLGFPRSTIAAWETGSRTPELASAENVAEFFDVSLDYLLGRSDEPKPANIIKESGVDYLARVLGDQLVDLGEMEPVAVLGRIAAGEPIFAEQNIEGIQMTAKSDIAGGEYFWLRVKGDSMADAKIADGDLVLVRKQAMLENGQIGIVLVNGDEATIKRVYLKGDQCMLVPENTAYQPQVYPAKDVSIVGEAVKVLHNLNGR